MSQTARLRIPPRAARLPEAVAAIALPMPPAEAGIERVASGTAAGGRGRSAAGSADGSGPRSSFRPDIEGMRGLAVVLVLLYHAAIPGWAGGYVGVDVFFVLSGFLITGLLLRELATTGRISLPGFYARRSRRILPAAGIVLVVTVVASALFLPPVRVPGIAVDGIWAALYSANVHFAVQATDYLQSDLAPSPLIHYWSLGVEEQFYLVWPALLLLVAGRGGAIVRRAGLLAAIVVVASFLLSVRLTDSDAPWAFFSLPTRAWELGLGALLAVADMRGLALPTAIAAAGGWLGLGLIAAAGLLFGPETPFPGTAALLPTVGAFLVIASGLRPARYGPGPLLASAVPRFFGRISYSLYLWSWPLLVIPAGALDVELWLAVRIALLLLAIAVATVTQRLVEGPLRRGRLIGTVPRRNLALAGAMSVVVVAVSIGAYGRAQDVLASEVAGGPVAAGLPDQTAVGQPAGGQSPGSQSAGSQSPGGQPAGSQSPGGQSSGGRGAADERALDEAIAALEGSSTPGGRLPSNLTPSLAAVRDDAPVTYRDGCHLAARDVGFAKCAYGSISSATTVVLFGDSHAAQWFPALERLAVERRWRLLSRTKSACTSADVTVWSSSLKRVYTECSDWRDAVIAGLAREHPAIVVLANDRSASVVVNGAIVTGQAFDDAWAAGIERTARRLEALGARVVVIGDTPRPGQDAPLCLSAHPDDVLACATPWTTAVDDGWRALERSSAASAGATFVDPTPWVCPSTPCPSVIGPFLVFRDTHHLTTPFAAALASRLGAALPAIGP